MLKGRCALITGSTQGLGYAMAARLAAEGCNIVMNGFGETDEIERSRRKIETEHGVRAIHHGADVADPAQIADLVATAEKTFGGVDVLINNAVVRHFAPVEEFKLADWDRALAVNLSSAFHTVRLLLPGMRERDFGRIVNVASIYSLVGTVNRVDYVIEARLEAERAKTGMSCIEAERAFLATRQPSGKFVAPERVAALVALLCAPSGADITGSAIPIDGGWSAS
jgi:3-hydroxybutyrate dehydrogenase